MVEARISFASSAFDEIVSELKDWEKTLQHDKEEFLRRAADRVVERARAECPRSPNIPGFTTPIGERHKPPVRDTILRGEPERAEGRLKIEIGFDDRNLVERGKAAGMAIGELIIHGTAEHDIKPRPENPWGRLFFHQTGQTTVEIQKPGAPRGEKMSVLKTGLLRQRGAKAGTLRLSVPKAGPARVKALRETVIVARKVRHPGTKPNDFIGRAVEDTRAAIQADFEAFLARKASGG